MQPIQLWLPKIKGGVHDPERQRDMTRVFQAWDRDHEVWTVPDWPGTTFWNVGPSKVRAVSGEQTEHCLVVHIGDNGHAVGGSALFPRCDARNLLVPWLERRADMWLLDRPAEAGEGLSVPVPTMSVDGIRYVKKTFDVFFASHIPIKAAYDEARVAILAVGNKPTDPRPISAELETQKGRYLDIGKGQEARIVFGAPFGPLSPAVVSVDDVMARAQMREVAELSADDIGKALRLSAEWSRPWVSEGYSNFNLAWLQPILDAEGELGALFALDGRFGIEAASLKAAYGNPACRDALQRPIRVRRAWGLPGLLWALLIEELERGATYRFCSRCGRPMSGARPNQEFCLAKDNPDCRRSYNRERKRATRSRKKKLR